MAFPRPGRPGTIPTYWIDRSAAEEVVARALAEDDDAWLAAADVRQLLEAYGISIVPSSRHEGQREAAAAAAKLGFLRS